VTDCETAPRTSPQARRKFPASDCRMDKDARNIRTQSCSPQPTRLTAVKWCGDTRTSSGVRHAHTRQHRGKQGRGRGPNKVLAWRVQQACGAQLLCPSARWKRRRPAGQGPQGRGTQFSPTRPGAKLNAAECEPAGKLQHRCTVGVATRDLHRARTPILFNLWIPLRASDRPMISVLADNSRGHAHRLRAPRFEPLK
jgi:hypothetical protein